MVGPHHLASCCTGHPTDQPLLLCAAGASSSMPSLISASHADLQGLGDAGDADAPLDIVVDGTDEHHSTAGEASEGSQAAKGGDIADLGDITADDLGQGGEEMGFEEPWAAYLGQEQDNPRLDDDPQWAMTGVEPWAAGQAGGAAGAGWLDSGGDEAVPGGAAPGAGMDHGDDAMDICDVGKPAGGQ
jgi:hypothetical protein